jgi:hypothetical protein
MPPLATQFEKLVGKALNIAQAGEIIRKTGDLEIRRQLPPARLEAIYEMAYLRIFLSWESFLEESFVRYLCGYVPAGGLINLINPPFRNLNDAHLAILDRKEYVSWTSPKIVIQRSKDFIDDGPHEVVFKSSKAWLESLSAIRNRIAHGSTHARKQFDIATMNLVGKRYPGSSSGRFLRDWNKWVNPPVRWIHTLGDGLKNLAIQIVPQSSK